VRVIFLITRTGIFPYMFYRPTSEVYLAKKDRLPKKRTAVPILRQKTTGAAL
jgi:hypothetical protein